MNRAMLSTYTCRRKEIKTQLILSTFFSLPTGILQLSCERSHHSKLHYVEFDELARTEVGRIGDGRGLLFLNILPPGAKNTPGLLALNACSRTRPRPFAVPPLTGIKQCDWATTLESAPRQGWRNGRSSSSWRGRSSCSTHRS